MLLSLKVISSPELGMVSRDVKEEEFGEELFNHMKNMAETMYTHSGVGLAGVQVGDMRRILVADLGHVDGGNYGGEVIYMVNPTIIEQSEETSKALEGCLSFPGLESMMVRSEDVIVKYKTPLGEEHTEKFSGYSARIILHEIDHFNAETIYSKSSKLKRKRYKKKLVSNLRKLGERMKAGSIK